jgi:hypothetical protein
MAVPTSQLYSSCYTDLARTPRNSASMFYTMFVAGSG